MSLILIGCNSESLNTNDSELLISKIIIPKCMPGLENIEDFENAEIYYKTDSSIDIEIEFNKNIKAGDYPLSFLQFGRFNHIEYENNNTNDSNYYYKINQNKLTIYPNNGYPMGIKSLFLPASLESKKSNRLEKDILMIFTPNTRTPIKELEFINNNINRSNKSLLLAKTKNNDRDIAFVNAEVTPLFSTVYLTDISLELYRGENVLIKDGLDNWESEFYNVEIYIPKECTSLYVNDKENIYSEKYSKIVNGYVKKEDLTIIPEPLNNRTTYTVKLLSEHDEPKPFFCVYPESYGGYEIAVNDNISIIEQSDMHQLESASIFMWPNILPGSNYSSTYGDGDGGTYSKYDIQTHMPEYYWNEEEYRNYKKAYDLYIDYMIQTIDLFKVPEELIEYKKALFDRFEERILLQSIWIDWGYNHELESKKWFFEEILNKFNLTNDMKYVELFNKEYCEDETQNFDIKINEFLNMRNNIGEYIQPVLNYVEEKYSNNDLFEDMSEISMDVIITSIISDREIIVLGKDNKEYVLNLNYSNVEDWKENWVLNIKGYQDNTSDSNIITIEQFGDIWINPNISVVGTIESFVSDNELLIINDENKNEYLIKFIDGFNNHKIGHRISVSGFYDEVNKTIETNNNLVRNYSTDMPH